MTEDLKAEATARIIDRGSDLYRALATSGEPWTSAAISDALDLGILFDGSSITLLGMKVRDIIRGEK